MSPARSVQPRRHLHRGTVVAAALWFDPSLLGEREARRRILAAWNPGVSVLAVAGGFLLRLARPRPLDCATAPGLPLTLEEGVLLSVPLSAGERAQLAPPPGSVVMVRAGRAEVFPADPSRRVEVAGWLDVSAWSTLPVKGLGAPPAPVSVLAPVPPPDRAAFGPGIPRLAPEAEALRARMEGRAVPEALQPRPVAQQASWWNRLRAWLRGERASSQATPAPSAGKARDGAGRAAPSWLTRMLGWLGQALSTREASASTRPAPTASSEPPPRQGPGLLSRLSEWLLLHTPLGTLLGQRKAEYVRRLFEMFEQGDLQEALRYAIPLGDKLTEPARIALGLPGPRESLSIQPRHGGGAASLFGGGPEVYAALKERYRAAFKRLEREGKLDEAAFVLTELLGAHEEAVSFLEKHGRLRLAAELAEGRQLAPGLVVRQWLLAKDMPRAVAIARRSGAFADAVLRLERTHPAEARTLRLLWAETLAEAGDYIRAVTVVWPLEDARPLARRWLEHGAGVGGVGGARALARLVAAFPDAFETARGPALELLEDDSRARAAERIAFASALAMESRMDARAALVGPVVRSLMRDRAAGHTRLDASLLTRLLRDLGDGTLRADLPPVSDPHRRSWAEETEAALLMETLTAAEAGPYPIHDAVALSGQRVLLALGEAGVRLVRADGTCAAHFDVPAFSLVASLHEDRVVALAPRGELQRLSRIELGPRRAVHWCDARVDAFAPSYDGSLWFIAVEDTVMAVDALAGGELRALWRVTEVEGPVMALEADTEWLRFATWSGTPELWAYALPGGPTLRTRTARRLGDGLPLVARNEATGQVERMDDYVFSAPWTLRTARDGHGQELRLLVRGEVMRATFRCQGEARVRGRFSGGELLLFDASGRLLRVDLAEGTARRVPLL